MVAYAINALTGEVTDIELGSAAERTMFRVMPEGGVDKLFFESREQYMEWAIAAARARARALSNGN